MSTPSDTNPDDEPLVEVELTETEPSGAEQPEAGPKPRTVKEHLLYTFSLPERALRTTIGAAGGVARESAALLVPQAFQDSKTYSIFVGEMLNFMAEDIGGVEHSVDTHSDEPVMEGFVARKTVGNFVEMAGLATMHLSPAMFLAIASDVAYGSKTYLNELSTELKNEGIIAENSTIDSVSDLLDSISKTSSLATTAFNTPPLSVKGLEEMYQETKSAVGIIDPTKVLPSAEIDRLWKEMQTIAIKENVSLLNVSSAITLHSFDKIAGTTRGALSSARVVGRLFDKHVLEHYQTAIHDINQKGYYETLAETSEPYVEAVWKNFSSEKPTITEDLLSGKLIDKATSTVGRWLGLNNTKPKEEKE